MFVIVMILLPLALVAAAALAALISIRNSSLRLTPNGVEIHNHRQPPQSIPLDRVVGFEPPPPIGWLSSIRPQTAILVLTDGSRLPVRSIRDPEAGQGIDALNQRLDALRRAR